MRADCSREEMWRRVASVERACSPNDRSFLGPHWGWEMNGDMCWVSWGYVSPIESAVFLTYGDGTEFLLVSKGK